MRSGRPDSLWIAKSQFEMLLDALPDGRDVGILGVLNATAAEVKRVLSRQDPQITKLPVEEQDRIDYIVHLSAVNPRHGFAHAWTQLSVRENSPIYPGLRRLYWRRSGRTAAEE